jgi:hypothetical protein
MSFGNWIGQFGKAVLQCFIQGSAKIIPIDTSRRDDNEAAYTPFDGSQLSGMAQVKRDRIDQCVSAGAERAGEIIQVVAVKHRHPGTALHELCWRRICATVGNGNFPASGKKLRCYRTADLPYAQDEGGLWH